MKLRPATKIAVIGAGIMGSGIAETAAKSGHSVVIIDPQQAALLRSRQNIEKNLQGLVARGRISIEEQIVIIARISWHEDLAAAAGSAMVIEAVLEEIGVKQAVFGKLEKIVGQDCILASNTSSLSISAIAATLTSPDRFLGLHFFNPVPVMKLVEIIPCEAVPGDRLQETTALMQAWGKVAVTVSDVPGFIVNRVARPYYAEGFAAWNEGVDPAVIDTLLVEAGGFRMGPLALSDMIGQDINYAVAGTVYKGYGDKARFRLQVRQAELVESGLLGRKSGSGVYDYAKPLPTPVYLPPALAPVTLKISSRPGRLNLLAERAHAAGHEIAIDPDLPEGTLQANGATIAWGDGRLLASRDDCTVLIDAARDAKKAPLFGITAKMRSHAQETAAFFATLRAKTVQLPDRPGLLVLRTLAQLANAAADALDDKAASANDIGVAMQLGANHPESPLDWADREGRGYVATVLSAIASETADPVYVPAIAMSA